MLTVDALNTRVLTLEELQEDARGDLLDIFPRLATVENTSTNNVWRLDNIELGIDQLAFLFTAAIDAVRSDIDGDMAALSAELLLAQQEAHQAGLAVEAANIRYDEARAYIDATSLESRQLIQQEIYAELAGLKSEIDGDVLSLSESLSLDIEGISATLANVYYTRVGVDQAITASVETMRAEIDTLDVQISGSIQEIKTLDLNALAGTAIGNLFEELQVDALGNSARLTTQGTAIADLEGNASAGYLIRAQAGGAISLIDLVAADDGVSPPTSVVKIAADDILLEGSVSLPMLTVGAIDEGLTTVHGNKIITGTVTALQMIKTQAVLTETAQLGTAIVKRANIGVLEVDSARIANLTVGTTKITDNATSAVGAAEAAGQFNFNYTGIVAVGFNCVGNRPLAITVSGLVGGSSETTNVRVKRSGAVVKEFGIGTGSSVYQDRTGITSYKNFTFSYTFVLTSFGGYQDVLIEMKLNGGSGFSSATAAITATEFKK